jgi:hypothetical protein
LFLVPSVSLYPWFPACLICRCLLVYQFCFRHPVVTTVPGPPSVTTVPYFHLFPSVPRLFLIATWFPVCHYCLLLAVCR